MSTTNTISKRNLSFDIIRIFALLSIVMVHVSAYIVINFPNTSNTEFIIGNIFNCISRAGVPLFLMLTGALVLNEDKKFKVSEFYKKSLLWMFLLLVGWVLAYACFYSIILPLCLDNSPSFKSFWSYILTFQGSNYPHLWYMFTVVGLYLIIPVLRLFVLKENKIYIKWIIIGCVIVQFLPQTLNAFLYGNDITFSTYIAKFNLEPLTGYLGLILLGWYLSSFEIKKCYRYLTYILAFIVVVVSLISVQYKIDDIESIRSNLYSQLSLPPFIYGAAMFILFLQLFKNKNTDKKWIKDISTMCFGVYIIHVIYLELFTMVILPYDKISFNVLAYILLLYAAVLISSFITVYIISKVPYIKKIFYIK